MKPWIIFLEAHILLVLASGLGIQDYHSDHMNPTETLHASTYLTAQSTDFHNPLEYFSVANAALDLAPEISLQINTTVIPRSSPAATWVEVTWKGVPFPNFDDFIALYASDADVTATAPIKFKLAARTTPSHYLISGAGSAAFRVLNLRQPLKFALIRGGLQTPRIAAWSESITPEEPNYPTQGHLSLPAAFSSSSSWNKETTELVVQWTTKDKGNSPPTVQWSTTPLETTNLPNEINNNNDKTTKINIATGASTTYTRSDMCGPPANTTGWFDPGWFHYVVITGLDPGKRYYYRYGGTFDEGRKEENIDKNGDDDLGVSSSSSSPRYIWSEEASFIAPPAPLNTGGKRSSSGNKNKKNSPPVLEKQKQSTQSVKLIALADLGQAEIDGSMEVSQMWASLLTHKALHWEVENNTPQLIIHNGDVSYARGYSTQWDSYWDLLGPAVRAVPYMTVPGNHERDWPGTGDGFGESSSRDSGGECGVAYSRRMNMPTSGNTRVFNKVEVDDDEKEDKKHGEHQTRLKISRRLASGISSTSLGGKNPTNNKGDYVASNDLPLDNDQPWYSFNFGPIHFLQFSTEHAFDPGSPQYKFIEADLASVDRTATPWVIVGGHRPIYLDSISWSPLMRNEDQVVAAALRAALEDLFLKYQVDATWTGHHHSYQRTCPIAKGKCIGKTTKDQESEHSIVHLIIGNAGAGLSPNIHLVQPKEFEVVLLRHGYLRVEANSTHMKHQMVATDTGLVMDEFVLVK